MRTGQCTKQEINSSFRNLPSDQVCAPASAGDRLSSHPTGISTPLYGASKPRTEPADYQKSRAVSDLRICRVKIRGSENCIFLAQCLLMSLSS
jgi:hypothetical protein